MKKLLNQGEIDAILGRAHSDASQGKARGPRSIEPCDFHNTGQMSNQYARVMTSVYEAFARSASGSLGAYLRAHFEMALASVELIAARDFMAGFQEQGFAAFLTTEPAGSALVMQVDIAFIFPIIDVLLGGFGKAAPDNRELTEIDHEIVDGVIQVFCRQLENVWQPLGLKLRVDRQQKAGQIQNIFLSTEKLTILTFEAKLNEVTGAISICFPATLANALLREMSSNPNGKARIARPQQPSLQVRIMDCRFDMTVGLPNLRVPARELIGLRPGSILNLNVPLKSAAALVLGGRRYFDALPVRNGSQRAAQLLHPADLSEVTQET